MKSALEKKKKDTRQFKKRGSKHFTIIKRLYSHTSRERKPKTGRATKRRKGKKA